ncbi:ATP-binding protein [Roseivirga sp. BDSF3-8]|uniref:ATP-binding protein n=1 Tax=Roseivirga sp. BDSF3-8 TaxID=3241598 RepID=UPI003531B896
MNLAYFIKEHKEEITHEWVEYASNYIDSTEKMSREEVKDHLLEMLNQISNDMETSQTKSEQKYKSRGLKEPRLIDDQPAKNHGIHRVESGFDIVQVSSEFRALRASVLRLWEESFEEDVSDDRFEEMIRFNEAIDEAWMHSVSHYHHKMDNSKNWFLGILGHDLRNPLSAIQSVQQLLSLSENISREEKLLLQQTDASIKRIKELIENLLELTNLRLGNGITVKKTSCDLTLHCERIIQEFKLAYPKANLHFESSGPIQGQWDSIRMEQVISNLVANALRYGRTGGPVTISVKASDQEISLSVHNEGNPIPESRKELIFNGLFKDSGENGACKESSYGIGLYVVHEIVKAHRGKVEVSSSKEDGTDFKVILPRY